MLNPERNRFVTTSYRSLALWTLGAVAAYVALYVILPAVAHAAMVADPTPALAGAVDTSVSIWTTDGPLWLAVATGYVALRTFLSKQHWLSQGRLLAGLTAAAGVLAAVMAWHFSGASVDGIYTALAVGVALLVHPSPVPVAAAPARNPQAGNVGGNMMAALGTLAVLASIVGLAGGYLAGCARGSTARQATAAGVVAALDCELLHVDGDVMADARLFADAKVQGWISGVKPGDTAALEAKIAADLKPIRSDVGHCAIGGALAAATAVVTQQPGTAVSALSASDPVQLRAAFAVAARAAGWAPVKVAGGAVI